MRTTPLRFLLACTLPAALTAQSEQITALTSALASDRPVAVATAAHAAREVESRELTAALQKALQRWAKDEQEHGELVRLFLLDALIARDAKVPGDLLVPMLDEPTTEIAALVLLCRDPAINERLLLTAFAERYGKPHVHGTMEDMRRVLVGTVLCERRAPGFAALLWRTANTALHVTVNNPGGGFGRAMSFQLPETRRTAPPEGFPKLPDYRLFERQPQKDPVDRLASDGRQHELLLARTPTRVGFSRNGQVEMRLDAALLWPSAQRESTWLTTIASGAPDHLRGMRNVTVKLGDDEATFVTAVREAQAKFVAAKTVLRDKLVAAGALTAEEAAKCDTSVEIVFDDRREDVSKPLPKVDAAK